MDNNQINYCVSMEMGDHGDAAQISREFEEAGTNLIINYLPQTLSDDDFKKLFSKYGPLKSCKICRNKATNYSYGFGFADFENHGDAVRAIEGLNGYQIGHKRLKVAFSRPSEEAMKRGNVYVKNLPKHFGDEDVRRVFGQFGSIESIRVLRDPITNVSKTVAFVLFEQKECAEKAINTLNDKSIEGSTGPLLVKFADADKKRNVTKLMYNHIASLHNNMSPYNRQPPPRHPLPPPSPFCLFVYNIENTSTESDLYRMFAPYGALQKIDIIKDMETDLCKGYAFVTYYQQDAAERAIMSLNGVYIKGKQLQVRFKNGKMGPV